MVCKGAIINPFRTKIVGGFPADITDIPYQASLHRYGAHFCGGSKISDKWILTAAHCTMDEPAPEAYAVRVGSTDRNQGGLLAAVKTIIQHPDYDRDSWQYDFTLLELTEKLPLGKSVQPIELTQLEPEVGQLCLVSGWGATLTTEESDELLRAVTVPVINRDACAEAYEDFQRVTLSMICAGDLEHGGVDACFGDSGGPIVADGVLVGVVSWGKGCAQPRAVGVYSNVAVVRDWITVISGV
ncbi:hypothetical protein quinque_015955 [Culex quinquefasciatus]